MFQKSDLLFQEWWKQYNEDIKKYKMQHEDEYKRLWN